MTQSTQSVSPLRQRMIDDMMMRKLSPKTQTKYIRCLWFRFKSQRGGRPQSQ